MQKKKEKLGHTRARAGDGGEERKKKKTTAFSRGGILPTRSRLGSICITGIYRQRGPAWRQNRARPRYVISLDSSSHDTRVRRSLEEERKGRERKRMRYASGGGGEAALLTAVRTSGGAYAQKKAGIVAALDYTLPPLSEG
ncbi:hypothetical protein X777_10018 [Ooceraea biroi]|uniref:Uncharacterized protein n=1 Tax=Ooceraea biroi TaxID=2015173 RepID=A0A026W5Q1_OOCBI|nr:hypothetical protein X777_10018 [Ooceraea biroi]